MDTSGQLIKFFTCILLGFLAGIPYELLSLTDLLKGERLKSALHAITDIVFFIIFAVFCIGVFTALEFSSFREYHYFGLLLGGVLYLKTFHKAVAFLKRMCYNGIKKLVNCVKSRKNFRKKEEKRF